MTSRRRFMKIVGSSALIVAGGAGGFALTRTPDKAIAPWARAGSADYTDPRIKALSYAILAPNPHNRQPWQVDLSEENVATLYCDLDRLLPETDPFERQILIGLGCFLDMLRMAAAQDGRNIDITPFPNGTPDLHLDTRAIARVQFSAPGSVVPDPLFSHVQSRRSLKEPFDTKRSVAVSDLQAIAAVVPSTVSVNFEADPTFRDELRDITWRAHLVEVETDRTAMESVHLMRIGKAEINANPDGIDIGGTAFLDTLALTGVLTRESIADRNGAGYKQGIEMYDAIINSAMAHLWLHTAGNSRIDQLNSGAAWLRVNMKATELGLGIHPLSQSLQEYVEMAPLYAEVHDKLLENPSGRIQMLGRLGYGPTMPPGPRWPIETRIL